MEVTYDPAKNERNLRERGLSFDRASEFEFETALYFEYARKKYGEIRYVAVGYLDGRLHILCFVATVGGIRVISFRKANAREARKYEKAKTVD